jgi:hypothetical protein
MLEEWWMYVVFRRAVKRDSVTGEIVREICAKPLPPSP